MREHAPVYYDAKSDVWAITKYDDVLGDREGRQGLLELQGAAPARRPAPDDDLAWTTREHQRRRSLVYHGFTPKRVARPRGARSARICNEIVDRVVRARRVRLRVGHRRAAAAAAHRRHARLRARVRTTTCCAGPTTSSARTTADPTPEVAGRVAARPASRSASSSSGSSPTGGRSRSRTTSISSLCHAEIDGERLDDESIVQETLLILIGGDETTRHVITGGHARAARRTPTSATILRDDPAAIETGVEELLRWVSPIKNMARTVDSRRRAARRDAARGRPGDPDVPVGQPRRRRCSPTRSRFDVRRDPNHAHRVRLRPALLPGRRRWRGSSST